MTVKIEVRNKFGVKGTLTVDAPLVTGGEAGSIVVFDEHQATTITLIPGDDCSFQIVGDTA